MLANWMSWNISGGVISSEFSKDMPVHLIWSGRYLLEIVHVEEVYAIMRLGVQAPHRIGKGDFCRQVLLHALIRFIRLSRNALINIWLYNNQLQIVISNKNAFAQSDCVVRLLLYSVPFAGNWIWKPSMTGVKCYELWKFRGPMHFTQTPSSKMLLEIGIFKALVCKCYVLPVRTSALTTI